MERNNQLKLLAGLLLLIIFFNLHLLKNNDPVEIRRLESSVIISDSVGFDLDNRSLTFGRVLPGTTSSRGVAFVNSYSYPVNVLVYGSGGMKDFIFSKEFEVEGYGEEDVSVIVIIPEGHEHGEYYGEVVFEVFSSKKVI